MAILLALFGCSPDSVANLRGSEAPPAKSTDLSGDYDRGDVEDRPAFATSRSREVDSVMSTAENIGAFRRTSSHVLFVGKPVCILVALTRAVGTSV